MLIKLYTEQDQKDDFYAMMGPHFASLEHKKELGGWQIYNKPESVWCLGFEGSFLVCFCGYYKQGKYYVIDNFVVLKGYRDKGYGTSLLGQSLKKFAGHIIRATTNNVIQQHLFDKFNLKVSGKKGSYLIYQLDCV